jgi:hypothetical protein
MKISHYGTTLAQCGSERQNLSEKVSLYCFGANEATIFKVSKEPRIKRITRIRLRHEGQACRVRQLLAGAIRVSIPIGRS